MADDIPVISERNLEKSNKEYNNCIRGNRPEIVIRKAIKYCTIRYDMLSCECNLTPEAVDEIEIIFKKIGIGYWAGTTSGYSSRMLYSYAQEPAREIAQIIKNPKYHIHCLNHVWDTEKCNH